MKWIRARWKFLLVAVLWTALDVALGFEAGHVLFPPKPVEHTIFLFLPQGFTIA
jgi:hypothetical protein